MRRPRSAAAWLPALAAAWACQAAPRPADARPNLVLVIVDTLRADALGSYGNPHAPSPELDALAAAGVRFARVVSQAPWTRPSVASLQTSLHPRSLGVDGHQRAVLDERFTTLAEALRASGYRTLGITANPHLNRSFRMAQGFDVYFDSRWVGPRTRARQGLPPASFPTSARLFRRIEKLLDRETGASDNGPDAPWFLQLLLLEVHDHARPERWRRDAFADLFPDAASPRWRQYLQAVRQVSLDLGAFVRRLAARPGWRDTLFAITSDHGEGLGSHPHVPGSEGHGSLLYESQLLVPWILYDAAGRLPAGRVVEPSVQLLDLMPTLLAYAGAEGPETMRGTSLRPLIEGRSPGAPRRFVAETHHRGRDKLAVYTDEWKLLLHRDGHPGTRPLELQARGREDGARTDRSAQQPAIARELATFLERWEREHPPAPPTLAESIPPGELEQLRALGYAPEDGTPLE